MSKTTQQPRHKQCVILSVQGWLRLEAAKQHSEIPENSDNSYTQEEIENFMLLRATGD